jgi:hypothetical protein
MSGLVADKAMTYTAMSLHDDLVTEGFDASSDEYYNEIDRRIRKEFPQKFEDQNRPTQKVASAVRKTSTWAPHCETHTFTGCYS